MPPTILPGPTSGPLEAGRGGGEALGVGGCSTPERIPRKAVGLQTMLALISGVGDHPVLVPECLGGSWDSGGLVGVLRAVTQSGDLGERGVN